MVEALGVWKAVNSRITKTKIDNVISSEKCITCAVPQGSILEPTHFLIYVNDLEKVFTHLKPIIYADDTSLFAQSKNLNNMIHTRYKF